MIQFYFQLKVRDQLLDHHLIVFTILTIFINELEHTFSLILLNELTSLILKLMLFIPLFSFMLFFPFDFLREGCQYARNMPITV